MIARKARWARDETGQIIIMTALLLTVLLFAVGIAFDLGTLFVAKRTLQEAVDAAAYAGSIALYNNLGGAAAVTAAQTDFTLNGYSTTDANIVAASTWWESPPTHAPWSGLSDAAQHIDIQVTYNVRVPLLPAEGGVIPVTVRSTGKSIRQASNYAIVALNPSAAYAFWLWSAGTVNINNGNVQVNSNCNGCSSANAAVKTGGATFTLGASSTAKVVGGQTGFTAGQWTTGAPVVTDPLAGYIRPSKTGLPAHGAQTLGLTTGNNAVTLDPGYWTGLLTLQGPNGFAGCTSYTTVTMNPGMYIMQAGLTVPTFNCVNVNGTGVTIFNTELNYPTETGGCGAFNLVGSGSYNVSAPTTGYYFGMHIFQDSYCTNLVDLFMTGSINTSNGSIYAPAATVWLGAGTTLTIGGHVIVDSLKFVSGGTINFNYDPTTAANALLPGLVN